MKKNLFNAFRKEFKQHALDYLLLGTGGILFLVFMRLFRSTKLYAFAALLFFVLFYIVWGIFHHIKLKDLRLKNIVEYIIIGFTILFLFGIVINV